MGCSESSSIGQSPQKVNPSRRKLHSRGELPLLVDHRDSFISHHLKYELTLSEYATSEDIRRRQIVEHSLIHEVKGPTWGAQQCAEFLLKSWMQRIFSNCIDTADKEFFEIRLPYDKVRGKLADHYLAELYQSMEFSSSSQSQYFNFGSLMLQLDIKARLSDTVLLPLLKVLKMRYPQVADQQKIQFPKVDQRKEDINLLDFVPNQKCFSDPKYNNYDSTFRDLEFLVERALKQFEDFKTDMKDLLGDGVLTDVKVKSQIKEGIKVYNASSLRRVFIKWTQVIIERIPTIVKTLAYVKFIASKTKIFNAFHMANAQLDTSSQQAVIEVILELLEAAKFNLVFQQESDEPVFEKNNVFGFFIYDLLRCKIQRKTPDDIMKVLELMEKTTITKTGKKMRVVRIKNRFKTPNRDLMVNFMYGDVIVAEAQLCVDSSEVDEKAKKTNKFNHYIYELERGLFGPTVELIMQYEDLTRPDLMTKMHYQGQISKRTGMDQSEIDVKPAKRKCLVGHPMIEGYHNYFTRIKNYPLSQNQQLPFQCDFCQRIQRFGSGKYDYCEKCSAFYCQGCRKKYPQIVTKDTQQITCIAQTPELLIKSPEQLKQKAHSSSVVVMFYHPQSIASQVLKDYLVYNFCVWKAKKQNTNYVYLCNVLDNKQLAEQYNVKMYPTTIVIKQDGSSIKTLIGANVQIVEGLLRYSKYLDSKMSQSLKLTQTCKHKDLISGECKLTEVSDPSFMCCSCQNSKPAEQYKALDSQGTDTRKKAFQCNKCKGYTCYRCGFLSHDDPATFYDIQGISYLADEGLRQKPFPCPKGHELVPTFQSNETNLKCLKCNTDFKFDQTKGMGYCVLCSISACPNCFVMPKNNPVVHGRQYISFWVEACAPEAKSCPSCLGEYKKLYIDKTKALYKGQKVYSKGNMIKRQLRKWKCACCNQSISEGIVHLHCLPCNYQICKDCATKQSLYFKPPKKEIQQIPTHYKCQKGHQIFKTTLPMNPQQLSVVCKCQNVYYTRTQHFACKQCKIQLCKTCGIKQYTMKLQEAKCDEGHPLVLQKSSITNLGLRCAKTKKHIIKADQPHYTCGTCKNYNVCSLSRCEFQKLICLKGHPLSLDQNQEYDQNCNICGMSTAYGQNPSMYCQECKFFICDDCTK